jgi:drug/metabolite transporter (DMT)-like permease
VSGRLALAAPASACSVGSALALTTALLFGASFVVVRLALERAPNPQEGGVVIDAVACLVAAGAVVSSGASFEGVPASVLIPLVAAGALAPGLSQVLLVNAIAASGAARTAQIVGATPLVAAALAVLFLGEPVSIPFLVGTAVIVCGVAIQSRGPAPTVGYRTLGLVLAGLAALAFAGRDNLIRSGVGGAAEAPALVSATIVLAAGTAAALALALASHRRKTFGLLRQSVVPFAPAGVVTGLAYICLAGALHRLRVTVVSPLVATQTLWGLFFSVLLLRRHEALGPAVALAAVLIVVGAAIVGAARG